MRPTSSVNGDLVRQTASSVIPRDRSETASFPVLMTQARFYAARPG
jgi:hypothetical protein